MTRPLLFQIGMTWEQCQRQIMVGDCNREQLSRVLRVVCACLARQMFAETVHYPDLIVEDCEVNPDDYWGYLLGEKWVKVSKTHWSKKIAYTIRCWGLISMKHTKGPLLSMVGDLAVNSRPDPDRPVVNLNTRHKIVQALAVCLLRESMGNVSSGLERPARVTDTMIQLARDPLKPWNVLADAAEDEGGYHNPVVLGNLRGKRPALWAALACVDRHPFQRV